MTATLAGIRPSCGACCPRSTAPGTPRAACPGRCGRLSTASAAKPPRCGGASTGCGRTSRSRPATTGPCPTSAISSRPGWSPASTRGRSGSTSPRPSIIAAAAARSAYWRNSPLTSPAATHVPSNSSAASAAPATSSIRRSATRSRPRPSPGRRRPPTRPARPSPTAPTRIAASPAAFRRQSAARPAPVRPSSTAAGPGPSSTRRARSSPP